MGEKPQKPPSGFLLYTGDNREAIMLHLGDQLGRGGIAAEAGKRWKLLSEEEKEPFEKRAADLKAKYNEELAAWTAAGGVKTVKTHGSKKGGGDGKRRKVITRTAELAAGFALNRYLAKNRQEIMKGLPNGATDADLNSAASLRFKALSDFERQPYEAEYAQFMADYKAAVANAVPSAEGEGDDSEGDEEKDQENAENDDEPVAKNAKVAQKVTGDEGQKAAAKKELKAKMAADAQDEDDDVLRKRYKMKIGVLVSNAKVVDLSKSEQDVFDALKKTGGSVVDAKKILLCGTPAKVQTGQLGA